MAKAPTKPQQWQRKRWKTKGHITAIISRLRDFRHSGILTAKEMITAKHAANHLEHLLFYWGKRNDHSKQKYLLQHD